ncbi:MAG TPA: TIGR01777 family oxidoreductase [Candidatus Limnocylindrales bacterium]|nr:TIGR01777 family oxidoreductase [Candidatus Limnocylindrales bacterium]
MKVVVTGGSGLIGRALAPALLEAGHEVVVLSRRPTSAKTTSGVRTAPWTPGQQGEWVGEVAGAGAVVNLAGESVGRWPWTPRRRRALRESRMAATRAIVEAIASLPPEQRPGVLLNASGTDLYEGRDAVPADESTPPADTFLGRLCVDWEAEARRAEPLGVRVVLFRMSLVVAPRAASLRLLMLPFRLFVGGRVGSGRQWMSWVAIDDVVGLALAALERPAFDGPVNVAAPDPRPQAEFATAIARAVHRPSWFPTPAWAIRLALGEQSTLALGSRRVWPAKALDAGYEFRTPRLEDALERAVQ